METAIEINDISFAYKGNQLFKNYSLNLPVGKYHLVGPNGRGKTTLLKIIIGLIIPHKGGIKIFNEFQNGNNLQIKKNVGYVPSMENSFILRMTGRENLSLFAQLYDVPKEELDALLSEFSSLQGLQNSLDTQYYRCSSGMKKILSIVRCFLHKPKVLVMDEPFSGLDKQTKTFLLERLKSSDQMILITSHQKEFFDGFENIYLEDR